ncbi:hypothetical protein LXL04_006448 [Taraxacum kok-saghyz]
MAEIKARRISQVGFGDLGIHKSMLIDLHVNYDCHLDASNSFERMVQNEFMPTQIGRVYTTLEKAYMREEPTFYRAVCTPAGDPPLSDAGNLLPAIRCRRFLPANAADSSSSVFQTQVLKTLKEPGRVYENELVNTLEHEINSSSKFAVNGKYIGKSVTQVVIYYKLQEVTSEIQTLHGYPVLQHAATLQRRTCTETRPAHRNSKPRNRLHPGETKRPRVHTTLASTEASISDLYLHPMLPARFEPTTFPKASRSGSHSEVAMA